MLYRKVPCTQDSLPILGFGCMRFPEKNGKIDEALSIRLLRHAIDNGVTYLDTGWSYHDGQSEPFLSRALADGYREKVKIATKLPQWLVKSREDMDFFLNTQLKRLKTDHIDYYLIHSVGKSSWENLKKLGIRDFLDTAKQDGRIIFAGFSFHEGTRTFCSIVDEYSWQFCQIQYNILDEHNQAGREGLNYAAGKGLGVIIMEPLRGGKLSKQPPVEVEKIWKSAQIHRTYTEWALLWLWDQPEVTTVLSGMNELFQIDENINTADTAFPYCLNPLERDLIRNVSATYQRLMMVPCTGCQYCMPCPFGVNISSCFEYYNNAHMFRDKIFFLGAYAIGLGGTTGGSAVASQCRVCGVCSEVCPQNIDIPKCLSEVADFFEGRVFRILVAGARLTLPIYRKLRFIRNMR